jgi:hypothetical protein
MEAENNHRQNQSENSGFATKYFGMSREASNG